jgi:hypothetical protein
MLFCQREDVYDIFANFGFTDRLFVKRQVFFKKLENNRGQEQNRKIGIEKVFKLPIYSYMV